MHHDAHHVFPKNVLPGDTIEGPYGTLEVESVIVANGRTAVTFKDSNVFLHNPEEMSEGKLWAFLAIGAVVGLAITLWMLRDKDEPAALAPPKPPSELDAAVQAAIVHPGGPLAVATQEAYQASHPECPANPSDGGADCAAAYTRVQGYVQQLLAVPLPVPPPSPPNACDPLSPPPAGQACVPAGESFVLVPAAGASPAPQLYGDVGVSGNYEEISIGDPWPLKVLDAWLDGERKAGRLAVRDDWSFTGAGLPSPLWDSLGRPGAREAYEDELAGKNLGLAQGLVLSSTAARTLRSFAASHFVQGPSGVTVKISDLPQTKAIQAFYEYLARKIAQFQKRSF